MEPFNPPTTDDLAGIDTPAAVDYLCDAVTDGATVTIDPVSWTDVTGPLQVRIVHQRPMYAEAYMRDPFDNDRAMVDLARCLLDRVATGQVSFVQCETAGRLAAKLALLVGYRADGTVLS